MRISKYLSTIVLAGLSCFSASAALIDTTGSNFASVSFGNSWTISNVGGYAGLNLKITAWGLTGTSNTTFQTASLQRFSSGLGVCDQGPEASSCGSPNHTTDNVGAYNFVMYQFSAPVTLQSVVVVPFSTSSTLVPDRDVSYFVGNSVYGNDPLSGKTLAQIVTNNSSGFYTRKDNDSTDSWSERTVNIAQTNSSNVAVAANTLLFGARVGTDLDDYLKLKNISFYKDSSTLTNESVPEPATFMSLGAALLAFGFYRRNSKRS